MAANGRSGENGLTKRRRFPSSGSLTAMARGYASTVPAEVRRLGRDQTGLRAAGGGSSPLIRTKASVLEPPPKKRRWMQRARGADLAPVGAARFPTTTPAARRWMVCWTASCRASLAVTATARPQFGTEQRVERLGQRRSAEGSQRAGIGATATTCSPVSPDSSRNAT